MSPATLGTLTGILAVSMSLAIPILAIICVTLILLAVARNRHRERMKMIEQGMMPPAKGRTGNFYPLLIIGAILFALGLGLFLGELFSARPDFEGGFILGLPGLAMLACFVIVRRLNRNRRHEPDRPPNPPSS